jgi:hypothetical protein
LYQPSWEFLKELPKFSDLKKTDEERGVTSFCAGSNPSAQKSREEEKMYVVGKRKGLPSPKI